MIIMFQARSMPLIYQIMYLVLGYNDVGWVDLGRKLSPLCNIINCFSTYWRLSALDRYQSRHKEKFSIRVDINDIHVPG
jgi:hypothetical protein